MAQRLKDYNFEVLEKDLSGMWAIQSQMRGGPPTPEATDEQLKDAIWIVLMFPLSQQGPMQPPADFKKVSDHLNEGGSALLMFGPQTDNFADGLKPFGIEVNTGAIAAHEPIKLTDAAEDSDILAQAARYPFVFDIDGYGDHMITKPLQSLSGFFVPLEVVKTPGAKVRNGSNPETARLRTRGRLSAQRRQWSGKLVRLTDCPNPPKGRPCPEIAGNRANIG